jgi:5-formyltetrahydrofolate cyclo-ligase
MAVPPLISPDALKVLRRDMRKLRQHLANTSIWQPAGIPAELAVLFAASNSVGLYAPMSGEPDPASISCGPSPKLYARPSLTDDNMLQFREWSPGDAEVPALWGGTQPHPDAPIVVPDLIFVPLTAFDDALNRLGQGGGHYDRYLAAHPSALRVGVAWAGQRVDRLPTQPWDIPLDAIITEQKCHIKELRPCLTR